MSFFRSNIEAMKGYVPGEQPRGGKFIKLNTNECPYPCSPKVRAAIGRAVQAGLEKYPDPGAFAFRARAAELFAADVPGVSPEWILCGNGSDDILTIAMRAFVGEGETVRYANPTYSLYKTLAEIQGCQTDVVDYDADWRLGEAFIADGARLAFLANPNGPSGTVIPVEEVRRIADALPCPLLIDEAYVDFAEQSCLGLVAESERVMVSRSLSKSYALAGLRFGFVVAQPSLIAGLAKVKDSYNCDALSIAGATAAIDDREWFETMRTAVLATRSRMTEELRGLGFECIDSHANFVWCDHPDHDPASLYEKLKAEGILVRHMVYPGGVSGVRITVGTDEQVDALLERLRSIC